MALVLANISPTDPVSAIVAPPHPLPEPPPTASKVTFPQLGYTSTPATHHPLMEYHVPMDKAKALPIKDTTCSAYGSISDPSLYLRPASPTTPFEFPFQFSDDPPTPTFFADEPDLPRLPMDGVQRVVGLPQVFGLHGDISTFARVNRSAIPTFPHDDGTHPSMVDGGANICVRRS